jgi:subtilisin family serine protease
MRRAGPVMSKLTVRRAGAAALGALLAVGGTALTAPAAAAPPENRTAVIVQLRPGADPAAESRRAAADGGSVHHVYRHALRGFAGAFTDRAIANMRRNANVTVIEPDGVASATGSQSDATWGLDRVDTLELALDRMYDYPATGAGVTAYVIDTGIAPHEDFAGRLASGHNTVRGKNTTDDCNGHGTHVAGTIGGSTYGIAKAVTLVPVRVLDCRGSGTWSGVVAGIDWVTADHQAGEPAVANLSLGGGVNRAVDTAVATLVGDGVSVAVAAGNDGQDACKYSPARVREALTTGATDSLDKRTSWSNWGDCLDLFAPGSNITSAWLKNGTETISGTSMAAPHVAGAAALLLEQDSGLTPADVAKELTDVSSGGRVSLAGTGSPNELLHVTAYTP